MKNILFVSYGGGHVTNLLPVYKELCKFPLINPIFLALTTAQNYLKQQNVNYIGYKDFPLTLPEENCEIAVAFLKNLQNQSVDYEESLAYLGWNMWDLEKQHGKDKALEKYAEFGRACFYPINFMKMFLKTYSIDLVVTTSAPRSEKAVIDAARELKIPSVCVPDIAVNLDICNWLKNDEFADILCVATQKIKEKIVNLNRNPKSIFVTGSSAIESFSHDLTDEEKRTLKMKIKIAMEAKIILYAPSPEYSKNMFTGEASDENLPKEILDTICSYFGNKDEYHVIYRPHPNQKFSLAPSCPDNITVDNGYDLRSIIAISDLVITTASTVGILAQISSKPLLAVTLSVHFSEIDYSDFGDFVRIDKINEINSHIENTLKTKENKYFGNIDSNIFQNSTKNITDQIKNILNF